MIEITKTDLRYMCADIMGVCPTQLSVTLREIKETTPAEDGCMYFFLSYLGYSGTQPPGNQVVFKRDNLILWACSETGEMVDHYHAGGFLFDSVSLPFKVGRVLCYCIKMN